MPDSKELDHPLTQRLGAILWPSFFAACVCTMVFFAFVDPVELKNITFPNVEISRTGGYTIGFFMFWLATAASSTFTWLLLRKPTHVNKPLPPK